MKMHFKMLSFYLLKNFVIYSYAHVCINMTANNFKTGEITCKLPCGPEIHVEMKLMKLIKTLKHFKRIFNKTL